jgi:AraC-like DNA-binding protein
MAKANTHHIDHVLEVVGGLARLPADGVVRKSWIRSANAHGVDPGSRDAPRILTLRELRDSQEAAAQLIDVARVELDHLYKIVRPAGYAILLCDKDGLVIEHRGEADDAARFRRRGVWLGGVWSEGAEGTNGIGTSLAEGRPVTVHRAQHFRARHIDLSCSGAPIFNGDGGLLGVLDVSSIDPRLSEHAHALTGALTIASARAIEERLFRKQFHRGWIVATGPPDQPGSAMLLSVDRDQKIVGADRCARRLLSRLGHDGLDQGLGLWTVFERDDAQFRRTDRGDVLTQVRPIGSADVWPAILTPPEPALARWSQPGGEDLRLRPRLDSLALIHPAPDRARGGLPPTTLRRIRDYVDAHLEQTIDLESLAATAELSVYHFARTFKQSEGATPHTYVLERRVAKARELLAATDLPLSEIALVVGFADQSHFARRFRQTVGVSPGQFRKLQT